MSGVINKWHPEDATSGKTDLEYTMNLHESAFSLSNSGNLELGKKTFVPGAVTQQGV